MATLGNLFGASPVNSSDDSRHTFTADTDLQVATFALDNTPADFGTMDTLGWAVEYSVTATPGDDVYGLQIRVMNGATVLAAGDSGGAWVTVNSNITSTTDVTTPSSGETAFAYVNTAADQTAWDGASIELRQNYAKTKGADVVSVRVDLARVNGTYTAGAQSGPVGLATEADTPLTLSARQIATVGLATDTEASLALAAKSIAATGLATETGVSFALAARQITGAGLAGETDTALQLSAGTQSAPVGLATESDSAQSLGGRQLLAAGVAVDVEASLALSARQISALGLAAESCVALGLAARQITQAGAANENDVALPLSAGAQSGPVGLATEADASLTLGARQIAVAGLASEASASLGLGARQIMAVSAANENDVALALAVFLQLRSPTAPRHRPNRAVPPLRSGASDYGRPAATSNGRR